MIGTATASSRSLLAESGRPAPTTTITSRAATASQSPPTIMRKIPCLPVNTVIPLLGSALGNGNASLRPLTNPLIHSK